MRSDLLAAAEQARLALQACRAQLDPFDKGPKFAGLLADSAIAALEQAIQEAGQQEPVAWQIRHKAHSGRWSHASRAGYREALEQPDFWECRALFTNPTPAPVEGAPTLTDERITELGHRHAWRYKKSSDPHHSDTYTFNGCCLHNFARAIERATSPVAPVGAPRLTDEQIIEVWRDATPTDTPMPRFGYDFARALLSAQGCELATDATKQQREKADSSHLAAPQNAEDFRRRPASSEAAPSAAISGPAWERLKELASGEFMDAAANVQEGAESMPEVPEWAHLVWTLVDEGQQ